MDSVNHPEVNCPACGAGAVESLLSLADVPALVGTLWPSAEQARAACTGRIELLVCRGCGHVFNGAFDPSLVEYDPRYENSLHFSPTFQSYADHLAGRLVDSYDLRGKTVLEIGCGKGEFLRTLCRQGGNVGIGYDPSYGGESDDDGLHFVPGLYPLDGAGDGFDFLVCRHVLEHLERPHELLAGLRRSCRDAEVKVYLEVPNGRHTLTPRGQWDLIYPHISYFSEDSLRRLVERSGFQVLNTGTAFDDQFLYAEARPASGSQAGRAGTRVGDAVAAARRFASSYAATVANWRGRLAIGANGGTADAALWGVGAKGAMFLNAVGLGSRLRMVVDVNPRKWGRFVSGTGYQVSAPDTLAEGGVDTVVVVNDTYWHEIAEAMHGLGVDADIVCV